MNTQIVTVIVILIAAVFLFSFEWIAAEVVALLVLIALVIFGILTPREAFAGFGSEAVIAIGALLVIGSGLVRSGVVKWIATRLGALTGTRYSRLMLVSTIVPGLLSGVINIVAAVSIYIPALQRMVRRGKKSASSFLMPMSVSGLMGANLTLIGASHNLVVDNLLSQGTQQSFGFFEFAPVGSILLAITFLYSLPASRLLRDQKKSAGMDTGRATLHRLVQRYQLDERIWEVLVLPGAPICCKTLEEIDISRKYGLNMIMALRHGRQLPIEDKGFTIQTDDVLALIGRPERVRAFIDDQEKMVLMGQPAAEDDISWSSFDVAEAVVPPRSAIIGKTLGEFDLRYQTGITAIGIWRDSRPIRTDLHHYRLQGGDAVLLFGNRDRLQEFQPEPELLWMRRPRRQEAPLHLRKYAPYVALIFLAIIVTAALDIVSIAIAALIGAAVMVMIGLLSPRQAYREIDWRTLILIAGMYPMGTAMNNSGAAQWLAELIIGSTGAWGTIPALVSLGLLALLLTQPMHNAVAALIVTPVALQVANALNSSPKAFCMAVIVGASASFLMPVGHPAPLLIRGPGGYTNLDYLKFGLGLAVLVLAVIAFVIPLFWPLQK